MGCFLQVPHGLTVATLCDGLGRVPLLFLPRNRVEPQGAHLSRKSKEGMADRGQQRRNRGGKQHGTHVRPVCNQFMQGNPMGAQLRGAAHLPDRRHVEQTGLVELLCVHAWCSFSSSVRRATAGSICTWPSMMVTNSLTTSCCCAWQVQRASAQKGCSNEWMKYEGTDEVGGATVSVRLCCGSAYGR